MEPDPEGARGTPHSPSPRTACPTRSYRTRPSPAPIHPTPRPATGREGGPAAIEKPRRRLQIPCTEFLPTALGRGRYLPRAHRRNRERHVPSENRGLSPWCLSLLLTS